MNIVPRRTKDLRRMGVVVSAALVFWLLLFIRLVQIQLINRGRYATMAKTQYIQEVTLESSRGIIYDRCLNCLAINKSAHSLGLDIRKVSEPRSVATKLARFLGKSEEYYYRELTGSKSFLWLAREIEEQEANKILALEIPGVYMLKESKRVYPYKRAAAQVIGFTDLDERGLSGLEFSYDALLRGQPGWARLQKDATGQPFPEASYPNQKPEYGKNVILTIDYIYQSIIEEELRQSIHQFGADGGIVIMTNPRTGEILAMASEPAFDPNNAGKYPPETWRNRAITDVFEPGSTFKIVPMALLLQENLKNTQDIIFCENGQYKIYDKVISDYKKYGWLTVADVLINSSNIGMVKMALELDRKKFYQYARDFGFGVQTGIELAGEVAGELKNPVHWSEFTPAAWAMGYEVAVTPIQMAMAYGAIANGGFLLKPKLVLAVLEGEEKPPRSAKPEVIRRVLSEETAKTLTNLLEKVVKQGTGIKAHIDGLKVAGKTGTAHKYAPDSKGYSPNEFIASFIGFFPADNPVMLVSVMIDNPRTTYWGGEVAAPTFKRILQRIVNMENQFEEKKPPDEDNTKTDVKMVTVPNFTNHRIDVGRKIAATLGLDVKIGNQGELIQAQQPAAGTKVPPNSEVKFTLVGFNKNHNGYRTTPKVIGLSVREAINHLTLANLHPVVKGSGIVVRQTPKPGERIKAGAKCVLECQPPINPENFALQ